MAIQPLTYPDFFKFQKKLEALATSTQTHAQKSILENLKAQGRNAMVLNPIRNYFEGLNHSSNNLQKTLSFQPKMKKTQNEDNVFYSQYYLLNERQTKPTETKKKITHFLRKILGAIPKDKRKLGKKLLRSILVSSAKILNSVKYCPMNGKIALRNIFEDTEIFYSFLEKTRTTNHHKEKKLDHELNLMTILYSIFYLAYEKRSQVNKIKIFFKKSVIPLAYTLCALIGSLVEHFLNDHNISLLLTAIKIGSSFFLSIIITSIIGIVAGYFVSTLLDKLSEKILTSAHKNELTKSRENLKKYLQDLNIKEMKTEDKEQLSIRTAVKKLIKENKQNHFKEPFAINVFLKNDFLEFFSKDEEKSDKFFYLLHEIINNERNIEAKTLEIYYKTAKKIFEQLIPKNVSHQEKKKNFQLFLSLCLKKRPQTTNMLRKSSTAVYVGSDVLTDLAGMQAAAATEHHVQNLEPIGQLAVEMSSNFLAGLIPMGLGILLYLFLKARAAQKDNREVEIPNDFVFPMALRHLKNQLSQGHMLLTWAEAHKKNKEELHILSHDLENKEPNNHMTYIEADQANQKIFYTFKKSLRHTSDFYLTWPLTETGIERLRENVSEIEKKIKKMEESKLKKTHLRA